MSPEQVRGEAVDTRSDIFSFGVLLYRMLTGELPFAGPSQVESMAKILESQQPSPRLKNEAVPPELERILEKCLRKDRDDRYQDTRDLVVDLRNLRRQYDSGVSDSVSSMGITAPRKGKSFFGLNIPGFVAGVTIICLAIAWAIWGDFFTGGSGGTVQANENSLAIIGFENKTGDSALDWLETGLPEILLTDLSQAKGIQIISRQRILDCFGVDEKKSHTHEQCVDAAQSLGAARLLSGAFFKLGDQIRIDARLEDIATGTIVVGEKVVGDDPFVLVDSLTAKIAAALDLGQMENVAKYASSPEAFRFYHEGTELFWQSQMDEAFAKFEQAIAVDSTFALPYMRMGMVKTFQGRAGEAGQYYALAKQYEDGLPIRDRRLLDAYYDTWALQNYDDAFTKLKSLLSDYPDDAEIRTFYALYVDVFQRDTAAMFAQFDTVLMKYPTFAFGIENLADMLYKYDRVEEAIEKSKLLINLLPNLAEPRRQLAGIYLAEGRNQEAGDLYRALHEQYPDDQSVVRNLVAVAVLDRDFNLARTYAEALRRLGPDDPYVLIGYHRYLANFARWQGRFNEVLKQLRLVPALAEQANDVQQLQIARRQIGSAFLQFGMKDSAVVWFKKAEEVATGFEKLSYPIIWVLVDTSYADANRPAFKAAMDDFKSRVPEEFWEMVNYLEAVFESSAICDTAAMIEAYKKLNESQAQETDNIFEQGRLQVLFGQYEEGRDLLSRYLSGKYETTSGRTYTESLYLVGVAEDELGNKEQAIKRFQELLGLWGTPDFEIEEYTDAKARLARLQG